MGRAHYDVLLEYPLPSLIRNISTTDLSQRACPVVTGMSSTNNATITPKVLLLQYLLIDRWPIMGLPIADALRSQLKRCRYSVTQVVVS